MFIRPASVATQEGTFLQNPEQQKHHAEPSESSMFDFGCFTVNKLGGCLAHLQLSTVFHTFPLFSWDARLMLVSLTHVVIKLFLCVVTCRFVLKAEAGGCRTLQIVRQENFILIYFGAWHRSLKQVLHRLETYFNLCFFEMLLAWNLCQPTFATGCVQEMQQTSGHDPGHFLFPQCFLLYDCGVLNIFEFLVVAFPPFTHSWDRIDVWFVARNTLSVWTTPTEKDWPIYGNNDYHSTMRSTWTLLRQCKTCWTHVFSLTLEAKFRRKHGTIIYNAQSRRVGNTALPRKGYISKHAGKACLCICLLVKSGGLSMDIWTYMLHVWTWTFSGWEPLSNTKKQKRPELFFQSNANSASKNIL